MGITKEELEDLIFVEPKVERVSTVSSDGKNLLTRIPKEVRDFLGLKRGDKLRFLVQDIKKISLEILKENEKKKKKRIRRN